LLPAAVRLKLVDFMGSLYAADRKGSWTSLSQRKTKVATGGTLSVHQALVKMVNEVDHAVRMRTGEVVVSLYAAELPAQDDLLMPTVSLVDQKMQQETFSQVMESLRLAYFIPDGLHDLSSEDESVNRVSSRVYTLQLAACVSPLCEYKVVSELVLAVKHGHIEADLVEKVGKLRKIFLINCFKDFKIMELLRNSVTVGMTVVDAEFESSGSLCGLQRNQRASGVYVAFSGAGVALDEVYHYRVPVLAYGIS